MKTSRSIRIRLLLLALAGIILALSVSAAGLVALFGRHVERRVAQELDTYAAQIAGNLRIGADGALVLPREPQDARFTRPLSGIYWQVRDEEADTLLRSISLWDARLASPPETLAIGDNRLDETIAPDGEPALLYELRILLDEGEAERPVLISVAVSREETEELKAGFARDLIPGLALLGAFLLAGAWLQTGAGLRPLARLRSSLADVRSGAAKQLPQEVPPEIAPLVDELNSLLEQQRAAMMRARERAADLAHGLKTPLTALGGDVQRLNACGEHEIAADIGAVANQMRRIVERELARSRLRRANGPTGGISVGAAALGIARTLARTPDGETLRFDMRIDPELAVAMDADDLNEVLGNLMENAARAARTTVCVSASRTGPSITIKVSDDGPGTDPDRLARIVAGGRWDEAASGSAGLGLAIVSDILEAYGAKPEFDLAEAGGLAVSFTIPAMREAGGSVRSDYQ